MRDLETVYIETLDITIIIDHSQDEDEPLELINYYYGKPNKNDTAYYSRTSLDVYVVICNGVVSSESYTTRAKAKQFIKTRAGEPYETAYGVYKTKLGDEYIIKVLNCK